MFSICIIRISAYCLRRLLIGDSAYDSGDSEAHQTTQQGQSDQPDSPALQFLVDFDLPFNNRKCQTEFCYNDNFIELKSVFLIILL